MKNLISKIALILILCCTASLHAEAQEEKYTTTTLRDLPQLMVGQNADGAAFNQGVSGAFAGVAGDGTLVVAGGCNFPDTPAAEGGQKRFYNDIFRLAGDKWERFSQLDAALAYGASVSTGDGLVCIGGTDGTHSRADVQLISLNVKEKTNAQYPALPVGLDNFAAAYDKNGGYIYVVGGQTDGVPSLKVWRLQYPGGKAWEALPDMPGNGRLQPCAVVQNGNLGTNLYVFGGFTPAADKEHPETATTQAGGLCYNIKTGQWTETAPMLGGKAALVGACAVPSGSQHILFFGGVDKDIFTSAIRQPAEDYLRHEPSWYKFRQSIMVYNTITNAWSESACDERLARAGAQVVEKDGEWIVIGGETMPGIRSAVVTAVKIATKADFGWLNWTVLVLYLLGMIALGYYFMKRESGAEDFFKGGGRIPWWAAGISIYATMLSAITYMAYPAKAFATDWTYYPMLVTILIVSFPVIHYYLPFFRRLNVTTAYEYLERRFNAVTRLMASALFIIFMVARMALVLYLPSLALTAVTGIDIYICIVLMAAITILYCTMGGVEAVVWGDVVQGFILVGGAIFAVIYLVCGTDGGFSGFLDIASADDKFRLFDWSLSYKSATFWVIIIGGMANNLISYTSDQTVIQRYLTTKDEGEARRSIMMNGIMSVFVSVAFFAIGAGLYTFFKTHPAEMDITMAKNDIIFPFFMMSQLPAGIAGLLIAAIFAATMSTISSNINSVATAFSVDFYKRFRPTASDKSVLSCARYTCIVSGVLGMGIALLMATWNILSLLDFFQEILGLLSSGLGGLFLMGIFFPRIGGKAALMGFVSGVAAVFVTKYCTEASFLLYGAIGMCVSVCVGYLLSFVMGEKKAADGLTWSTLKKE
ncbi:MAG: cyclically-permuted mutarotase family protein [Bacteroidales bacterium]|nr:cyclically-permuted mutarotase family protein [Bacteroidales bacterium]